MGVLPGTSLQALHMFGIGLPELLLIMAIALIVVGPEKLPELAKTLARQVVELKRAANALQESLHDESVHSALRLDEGSVDSELLLEEDDEEEEASGEEFIPPLPAGQPEDQLARGESETEVEVAERREPTLPPPAKDHVVAG